MSAFELKTKRLIFRHLQPSDLEDMFALDSDPIVHKYLGNRPHISKEQSKKDIDFNKQQHIERGIARWATIEKSSGDFIGWSGLRFNNDIVFNHQTNFYDVGYRFIPKYWGKGYATESAILAMNYFFDTMKKDVLVGVAEQNNTASNRVLKKIGLKFRSSFKLDDTTANWYDINKTEYAKTMS